MPPAESKIQHKHILWVRWLLIIATTYLIYFNDTAVTHLDRAAATDFYLVFFLIIMIAAMGRSLAYIVVGCAAISLLYGWMMWPVRDAGAAAFGVSDRCRSFHRVPGRASATT